MNFVKNYLLLGIVLASFSLSECASKKSKKPRCKTEKSCINDNSCECYCSRKCGFREKEENDQPVYVENDPNGKYCYCKQWDLDNYKENCKNRRRRTATN